jgi:hypothetical protein
MNDATLNWKKIRRILPKARRYALDRTPTLVEMHEIIEAADFRGKALTLVLTSSGIREGEMIKPTMVSNKITEEVFARCEFLIIDNERLSSST